MQVCEPLVIIINIFRFKLIYLYLLRSLGDVEITSRILTIFRRAYKHVPEPIRVLVTRWGSDQYALGSYSYSALGATDVDFDVLGESVDGGLFFAGEHTCRDYPGYALCVFILQNTTWGTVAIPPTSALSF